MQGSTNIKKILNRYENDLYATSVIKGLSNNTIALCDYSLLGGGVTESIEKGTGDFAYESKASTNKQRLGATTCGTNNNALCLGGRSNEGSSSPGYTEYFNGIVWEIKANMINANHNMASCGMHNSALALGGNAISGNGNYYRKTTEYYNGTSWSAKADMSIDRDRFAASGISNNALAFGGMTVGTVSTSKTEHYNGIEWITKNAMPTAICNTGSAGTGLNALAFGGRPNPSITGNSNTYLYNNGTWSTGNKMMNDYSTFMGTGCGDYSNALAFGHNTTVSSIIIEHYNNGNWSTSSVSITGHDPSGSNYSSCGNYNNALLVEGHMAGTGDRYSYVYDYSELTTPTNIQLYCTNKNTTSILNANETHNVDENLYIKELEYGWVTRADMNIGRDFLAGCGNTNDALSITGSNGTYSKYVEYYNNNSWSSVSDALIYRTGAAACGNYNSALLFSGNTQGGSTLNTEYYNGSSWSDRSYRIKAMQSLAGCGNSNNALAFGGETVGSNGSGDHDTEYYNGTSWSAKGNMNLNRKDLAGCGMHNDALAFGGYKNGVNQFLESESYNGSTWSIKSNINICRQNPIGSGIANSSLAIGGREFWTSFASLNTTEYYNGISWINKDYLLNNTKTAGAGCGFSNSTLVFGGDSAKITEELVGQSIGDPIPLSTYQYRDQLSSVKVGVVSISKEVEII